MAKKLGKTTPVASKSSKSATKRPAVQAAKPARAAARPPAKSKPTAAASAKSGPKAASKKPVNRTAAVKASAKPAAKPLAAAKPVAVVKAAAPAKPAAGKPSTNGVHKSVAKNGVAAKAAPVVAAKASDAGRRPAAKPTPPAVSKPATVSKTAAAVKPADDVVAPPPAMKLPASVKPGVKGGNVVAAKLAINPGLVSGLAAERSTPVVKLVKTKVRPDPIPVRLPPAPVRSDSKMARNQAGISQRELEHFRDLLYEKRREITGDVSSMEGTALRTGSGSLSTLPMHMADNGTDNYEQEFTLGLVEKDRKLLHDINVALAKIQDGSYGICEGTGKPISKPRLEAQPWAKYSIEHARQLERPQFRRAF